MLEFDANGHTYTLEGKTLVSVSSVVASQFRKFNARAVSSALSRKKESSYYGMKQEEILQQWNETGKVSRDMGIRLHGDIENFFNFHRMPSDTERRDWIQFMAFVNDHPDWKCIATEKRVHNDKVAGTIDAVFQTPDGLVLVDWKRCKAMDFSGYGMGRGVMKHVPDCNYSKYSLQLSLYKQLIHEEVVACYIIQMHPDLDTYQKIRAQDYHLEAQLLI